MSFFRLRPLPGNTWPPLPDGDLAQVWSAYQTLDRTQWLAPAEIERRQLAQLRTLLAHCAGSVPYYRNMLSNLHLSPDNIESLADFRRLPLLSRATCHEQREGLQARDLPRGTVATGEVQTSGSSGIPLRVAQTNMVVLWWFAFFLRDLEWGGLDPTGRLASIHATGHAGAELRPYLEGVSQPSWAPPLHPLLEMGPMYVMDIQQGPRRQLRWLRDVAPDYLRSSARQLELLASLLAEEGGAIPRLRAIQTFGDSVSEECRGRLESVFGVPVKNCYSCAEAGYLASPCPHGHGLHVHAENVLLEILDEDGRPCRPGERGRVVLTTLHNFRAPFVRYDIGDEAVLGPERCPCGRGLPLMSAVWGKGRILFRLSGGRLKRSDTVAVGLTDIGGHRQHQVIQKAPDYFVVRLVLDPTWTPGHAERVRRLLQDFAEAPVRVDLQIEERLQPPPGGKLQSMVCEVGPDAGEPAA